MTGVGYPGGGTWMIQNRAHAEFNSLYMLCPNTGPVYLGAASKHPVDIAGGNSHIVDYRGQVVSYSASTTNTCVAATIDIEGPLAREPQSETVVAACDNFDARAGGDAQTAAEVFNAGWRVDFDAEGDFLTSVVGECDVADATHTAESTIEAREASSSGRMGPLSEASSLETSSDSNDLPPPE